MGFISLGVYGVYKFRGSGGLEVWGFRVYGGFISLGV